MAYVPLMGSFLRKIKILFFKEKMLAFSGEVFYTLSDLKSTGVLEPSNRNLFCREESAMGILIVMALNYFGIQL